MPRVITTSVESRRTDELLPQLQRLDGVLAIEVHRRASVLEPGDVLVLLVTNRIISQVLDLLGKEIANRPSSLTIAQPDAVYVRAAVPSIIGDEIEVSWEEAETFLHRTSQLTLNFLLLMAFNGGLMASGLALANIPLVLAALLVMPGFSPLVYTGFGIGLGNRRIARDGLISTFAGFGVLFVSALLVYLLIRLSSQAGPAQFLGFRLLSYYTSFGLAPVVTTVLAAGAGATIVSTHRSVLISGVSIALGLSPGLGVLAIGLMAGQWGIAFRGLGMWAMEAAIVIVVSALVFWVKNRFWVHHGRKPWY